MQKKTLLKKTFRKRKKNREKKNPDQKKKHNARRIASMHTIKIITQGKELLALAPEEFLDYVNSLFEEKALINIDRALTLEEEKEWLKQSAERMDHGELVMVLLFVDRKLAGIADAWTGAITLGHNVTFGISVRKGQRGKRYGTMLLRTAIDYAKEYFKPHKMWIEFAEGNGIASDFYQKMGFVRVAKLEEYIFQYGEYRNKIVMEYRGE